MKLNNTIMDKNKKIKTKNSEKREKEKFLLRENTK